MIREKVVDIIAGSGGPHQNAIPVYADHNAPHGGQVIDKNGNMLMLENSEISGIHYLIVDPAVLSGDENGNDIYMSFKENGEVNYIRIWIMDENGDGQDYEPDVQMWVEYSHLQLTEAPEPPAPPEPPVTGDAYEIDLHVTGVIRKL